MKTNHIGKWFGWVLVAALISMGRVALAQDAPDDVVLEAPAEDDAPPVAEPPPPVTPEPPVGPVAALPCPPPFESPSSSSAQVIAASPKATVRAPWKKVRVGLLSVIIAGSSHGCG